MKYYLCKGYNPRHPITAGGLDFHFEQVRYVSGLWFATYATDDPHHIGILDSIVGTQGVKEIDERDYNLYEEKKSSSAPFIQKFEGPSLAHKAAPPPPTPPASPKASAASAPAESTQSVKPDLDVSNRKPINMEENTLTDDPELQSLLDPVSDASADTAAPLFATSQRDVAEALGESFESLRKSGFYKAENFPAKGEHGYEIAAVRTFLDQWKESGATK